MGHDRQNSNVAVIAVVLIGLLFLFIVGGGALVLLGGLFFMRSSEMVHDVQIAADYTEPAMAAPVMTMNETVIHVDAAGQATIDGAPLSLDELKIRLIDDVNETGQSNVRLQVSADCPAEHLAKVIEACRQATGIAPSFTLDAKDGASPAASATPNMIGD
jgi:biopolymer transport protein ExbD